MAKIVKGLCERVQFFSPLSPRCLCHLQNSQRQSQREFAWHSSNVFSRDQGASRQFSMTAAVLRGGRAGHHSRPNWVMRCSAAAAFGLASSVVRCASPATHEVLLGGVDEFEDGELYQIKLPGGKYQVLLTKVNGEMHCTGNSCSHYSAPLHKGVTSRNHVSCPWHNAEFDLKTGLCISGPGLNAIPVYPTVIRDGKVYATLPLEMDEFVTPPMVKRDAKDKRVFGIVGAGAAALAAAETLRQEGYTGRILMIGAEAHPPYDRPVLSKNFSAKLEKIILRDEDYLQNVLGVEFMPNTEVTNVDSKRKILTLSNNSAVKCEKILIATGATPRQLDVPGKDLKNIFVIRSPEDTAAIAQFAKVDQRIVVVGSSFIGMEAAAALQRAGATVTVVGMESAPYERILGPKIGAFYKSLLQEKKIFYHGNSTVKRFKGRFGTVNGVELHDGEVLQADAVVVGAGVIPNTNIVEGVEKARDGAVLTDPLLQVKGCPDVYAAGDIARYPCHKTGTDIRIEHWNVAMQQGRTVAKNMMGKFVPYTAVPFFWTMVFGKSLRYAGYGAGYENIIYEGDVKGGTFIAYYVKDNKVIAVATLNRDPAAVAFAEAMELGVMPSAQEFEMGFANAESVLSKLQDLQKAKPKTKNAPDTE